MARHWTTSERAKQATLIRTWKPWEQSTGPKTEAGKQASAMRGFKGGWRDQLRQLAAAMREQRGALDRLK